MLANADVPGIQGFPHPIYFSEVLLYLGFLMLSLSLAAAVVWCIAVVFLHYISRWEEKLLLDAVQVDGARFKGRFCNIFQNLSG